MTQFQFNGSERAVLEVDNSVNIFNGSLADESLAHFPPLTRTLFTTCFCFTLLFGTIGNLLVVTVVWNDKELSRSSTGVFIANLSIADLLVLVICLPSSIVELQSPPFVWVLPSALCKVIPFTEFLVQHASVLTILAISIERHHAICRPLTAAYFCTRYRAAAACLLLWIVAIILTSPMLVLTEHIAIDLGATRQSLSVCVNNIEPLWSRVYLLCSDVLLFFVPLVLLLLVFGHIAVKLLDKDCLAPATSLATRNNALQRRQVVLMLGTVIVFFFVCLIPHHVLSLWSLLSPSKINYEDYMDLMFLIRLLIYTNSTLNPVLYNATSSRFRNSLKKLFRPRQSTGNRSSSVSCRRPDRTSTNSTLAPPKLKIKSSWQSERKETRRDRMQKIAHIDKSKALLKEQEETGIFFQNEVIIRCYREPKKNFSSKILKFNTCLFQDQTDKESLIFYSNSHNKDKKQLRSLSKQRSITWDSFSAVDSNKNLCPSFALEKEHDKYYFDLKTKIGLQFWRQSHSFLDGKLSENDKFPYRIRTMRHSNSAMN